MGVWQEFNNNPCGRNVGDCAVRAISVALDISWEEAFALLADAAYKMCDLPSSDAVFGAVLRQRGFYKAIIPNSCPVCYTASDFANENPEGIFVVGFGGHVATIRYGVLYDSWDSSNEIPIYVWHEKKHPPFMGAYT